MASAVSKFLQRPLGVYESLAVLAIEVKGRGYIQKEKRNIVSQSVVFN